MSSMTKKESSFQFPAKAKSAAKGTKLAAKKKRQVQVVTCPSDFPTSSDRRDNNVRSRYHRNDRKQHHQDDELLDWNDTSRQIRTFASSAFAGKTKRQYKEEEYERLTGRKLKQQHVPQHITRGIKKKARQRHEKQVQEARLNGIVLPTTLKKGDEKSRSNNKNDGPAPSIGYMKQGVYSVKNGNKKRKR